MTTFTASGYVTSPCRPGDVQTGMVNVGSFRSSAPTLSAGSDQQRQLGGRDAQRNARRAPRTPCRRRAPSVPARTRRRRARPPTCASVLPEQNQSRSCPPGPQPRRSYSPMVISRYVVPSGRSARRYERRIGQLPADVRLGLQRVTSGPQRERVQRAARAAGEARPVEEDARAVDDAGLALAVVVVLDACRRAPLVAELPVLPRELASRSGGPASRRPGRRSARRACSSRRRAGRRRRRGSPGRRCTSSAT